MHLLTLYIWLFYIIHFVSASFSIYVVPSSLPTSQEDGSLEYPFSTIEQARDYFRKVFHLSFQRVALYPTYHFLQNYTLTFDERDHLTIYTKMTNDEQNQIQLSRKENLIELDFPIISGGVQLTNWTNDKGVRIIESILIVRDFYFFFFIDLEYSSAWFFTCCNSIICQWSPCYTQSFTCQWLFYL